mgnify:CR=1 FL=1
MLDKPTNPLDIARTVLKPETISEIKMWGFTNSAYLILDRWALNCPDELKELEAEGELALIVRLDQQRNREHRVLCSETAQQASLRGMSDWEILESCGVELNLPTTA